MVGTPPTTCPVSTGGGGSIGTSPGDDLAGSLTLQVGEVQAPFWFRVNGKPVRFACFITGDGKAMEAGHHRDRSRCWTCDTDIADPANMVAQAMARPG